MFSDEKRFNVSIGKNLDTDLERVARELGISKTEVIRRAIVLFKHASKAEKVILKTGGEDQAVLIK